MKTLFANDGKPSAVRPAKLSSDCSTNMLNDRYRVLGQIDPLHWRVLDFYSVTRSLVATPHEIPGPLRGRAVARAADERRILSWMRHPGLGMPRDVFVDEGRMWTVRRRAYGVALLDAIGSVEDVTRYGVQLCEALTFLERSHDRPTILGQLAPDTLRVTVDRRLVIEGFDLDGALRLRYRPAQSVSWRAPERRTGASSVDVRADVWCVGRAVTGMLDVLCARDDTGTTVRDPRVRTLRRIAMRALRVDVRGRYGSLFLLRRALERVSRMAAPPSPRPRSTGEEWPGWRWTGAVTVSLLTVLSLVWSLVVLSCDVPRAVDGLLPTPSIRSGQDVWVEGVVSSAPDGADGLDRDPSAYVAPLSGVTCVAWSARLVRVVERRTYDGETRRYALRDTNDVLLDGSEGRPFVLSTKKGEFTVIPGALAVDGVRERLDPLASERVAERLRAPLKVGEHVRGVAATEVRVRAGDRVYVHGSAVHGRRGWFLRVPSSGPLVIFDGTWLQYASRALARLLPLLLFTLSSAAAVCIGGGTLRRRGLPRRMR